MSFFNTICSVYNDPYYYYYYFINQLQWNGDKIKLCVYGI